MYYFQPKPRKKRDAYQMKQDAKKLLVSRDLKQLATLLQLPIWKLKSIAERPKYYQFYVPKSNGGKRQIETPNRFLKNIQKEINYLLQGVYLQAMPPASYGFISDYADASEKRNIYTNALQHVGKEWVLNVDLKDFFHSINLEQLRKLFRAAPFNYTKKAAQYLALLTTFRGRLPMGTPTSPILSNLICIPLDHELSGLAQKYGWRYTRYADDMTFSGNHKFTIDDVEAIRGIIRKYGFIVNEKKVKIKSRAEKPEVTGLVLLDKPDLSESFIAGIKDDIKLFRLVTQERVVDRNLFSAKAIQQLEYSIIGQINFVKFVRGEGDKTYLKLRKKLKGEEREVEDLVPKKKGIWSWLI